MCCWRPSIDLCHCSAASCLDTMTATSSGQSFPFSNKCTSENFLQTGIELHPGFECTCLRARSPFREVEPLERSDYRESCRIHGREKYGIAWSPRCRARFGEVSSTPAFTNALCGRSKVIRAMPTFLYTGEQKRHKFHVVQQGFVLKTIINMCREGVPRPREKASRRSARGGRLVR